MKLVIALALSLAIVSAARAETIGIFVGANVGSADDDPLRYAESDARRMRAVLVELGDLRPERAILVVGGGPAQLRAALDEARGRAAELANVGRAVSFLFYFSGHGDESGLHLPRGEISLVALRDEISRIPAVLHVSILDACRTIGRGKGVRTGPAWNAIALPEAPHGTIELRASSLGEGSQESEELGGAIFSHYLASALRGAGDSDRDGQVTLAEAYAYAYRRTLMRTGGAPGLQHPTLTAALAGAGEIVLSRPQRAGAHLEVPPGAERYLLFAMPSAAVVGEVDGSEGRELSVPPGRYLVARRSGGRAAVAEVDLSWGGRRTLAASEFRAISREELQSRGGRIELRPFSIEARAGVEVAPGAAEQPALGIAASFGWARGLLHVRATLGYAGGPLSVPSADGWSSAITGRLALGPRLLFRRATLTPLFGVGARYAWQTLTYVDHDRRVAAGLPTESALASGAIGPSLELHLGVPLRARLSFTASVVFDALLRRETDGVTASRVAFHPLIGVAVGLGYAL